MRKGFTVLLCVLFIFAAVLPCLAAGADSDQQLRFKGKVRYVESLAIYALLSDDGKKYHPMRKLPRSFQKDGLEVVVDARLRPDLVASRMYGSAVEVLQIAMAARYVSPEERDAVKLLLARMEAFNSRDLAKLREIDTMAAKLSQEQFDSWVQGWGKYTLHYVEATNIYGPRQAAPVTEGICLYSRQRTDSMALSGNIQYAVMRFSISNSDGKLMFASTGTTMRPDPSVDMDKVVEQYLNQAKQRYGTTELATWKGQ